jgi:hypothetical protein
LAATIRRTVIVPPIVLNLVRANALDDRRLIQGADNIWEHTFGATWASDWSGYAARSEFRRGPRDRYPEEVLAFAVATIISPLQRTIQWVMDAAASDLLVVPSGYWDTEIYNGARTYRVQMGRWELNKQVTA